MGGGAGERIAALVGRVRTSQPRSGDWFAHQRAVRCPARRQPRRLRASAARRARVSPRHPGPGARRPGSDRPRAARSARRSPWRRTSGFPPGCSSTTRSPSTRVVTCCCDLSETRVSALSCSRASACASGPTGAGRVLPRVRRAITGAISDAEAAWICSASAATVAARSASQLRGIAEVDAQRQRPPEPRILFGQLEQRSHQIMARVAVDSDREVNRDASQCLRRVDESPRQVEDVAFLEHVVGARILGCTRLDRSAIPRPGLARERIGCTGSWMTQRFEPAIWSTKTSWTS